MEETSDLSHLSYKELQALAHLHRVPGNIKKQLLVKTLQAIQSGNEVEASRMLVEVQQTRKKRVKKQKLNPTDASSTPIDHSSKYAFSNNDCIYSRQPLYEWVGAEEEITFCEKEEERMKSPNYTEFQDYILRQMQRDTYRSYRTFNEMGRSPSIVDLRMGPVSSVLTSAGAEVNPGKFGIQTSNSYISTQVELQVLEEQNDNQSRSELLKKLLEAPAGANLGEIATPDAGIQKIWSLDQHANRNNNPLDDSDTLTADSEIESDRVWENNNTINYYRSKNAYDSDAPNGNANIENQEIQHYSFGGYQAIQSNCEKWIASNNFLTRDANYAEQHAINSRNCNAIHYENNAGNSRQLFRDRRYPFYETSEPVNYEENQNTLPVQHFAWPETQAFPSARVASTNEGFYPQPIVDSNREYASQKTNGFQAIQNSGHAELQMFPAHLVDEIYAKENTFRHRENNNDAKLNSTCYSQYHNDNNQAMANFSRPIDSYQRQECENFQSVSNGVLESFWPRWPMNATPTSNGKLETILNLHNVNGNVDSSKINETSCVYCYTQPIVTQRVEGNEGCNAQNNPQAENRQHQFTPNVLVYNDSSTGMVLANVSSSSNAFDQKFQEELREAVSNENDYETRVSDDSSQSSINDVWIYDYTNYPVNSDNALQSVDLATDGHEDDLFSTVRDTAGNSIDEQAIDNFTDMSY